MQCTATQAAYLPLAAQALLLNPFNEEPPSGCRHELRRATLDALDDKERH